MVTSCTSAEKLAAAGRAARPRGHPALLPDRDPRTARPPVGAGSAHRFRDDPVAHAGVPAAGGVGGVRLVHAIARRELAVVLPAGEASGGAPPVRVCGRRREPPRWALAPALPWAPSLGHDRRLPGAAGGCLGSSRRTARGWAATACVIRLALDPRQKHLRTAAAVDRLAQGLSRHFGETLRVEIEVAEPPEETPARAEERQPRANTSPRRGSRSRPIPRCRR